MTLLLEIPVYRVSRDEWRHEIEERIAEIMAAREDQFAGARFDRSRYEGLAWNTASGGLPYDYNQVVGWIQVEWDGPGPAIKGYGFRVPLKRLSRQFRLTYEWIDKLFEVGFRDETNDQIASTVRAEIAHSTVPGREFAGRYVDLAAFDSLAPHLEWRRLIGI